MANDYVSALTEAMTLLGQDGRTLFIGQTAVYGGSRYTKPTLTGVPRQKLLEPPVTENLQMGISLGLALSGDYIPVSIYPRFDFIPLALDQLVNHLDKAELMSKGQFKPKVIIRTIVGGTQPIDPGPQHSQDHSEGVRRLLTNIDFVNLRSAEDIVPAYLAALNSVRSTFLVEYGNLHHKYSANQ
jgi:pyruvate/2-oxoglutarate/acetoin dehydrogenase E1 component